MHHPDAGQLPLHHVAAATGLEPSHVQYLLGEFHDLFPAEAPSGPAFLDAADLDLLRALHEQFFVLGRPLALIRAELGPRNRRRIWTVASGKGGVGKTTLSVNLAVALALRGLRVLLFDADFGMANAHVFAGVNPRATLLDVIEGRMSLAETVTIGPAGVRMICGASGAARLADIGPATREALLRELLRVSADDEVLLIDTGAGIAPAVLEYCGIAQEMIVVTTPNLAATLDAYGVVKAAREAHVGATVQLLVNEADDAAMADEVFARIKGCAERFLGFTPQFLGSLPADPAFEAANRQRRPLVLSDPENPNSRRIRDFADRLLAGSGRAQPVPASEAFAAA